MFQFFLILLRNPIFLIGTAIFIAFAVYYNRLLRSLTQTESKLEALEQVLILRRKLVRTVVHPEGSGVLGRHLGLLEMPESIPMLTDDLVARFEEERALGEDLEQLIRDMDEDKDAAKDSGYQEWKKQVEQLNQELAVARADYNNSARAFNLTINSFPGGLVANVTRMNEQEIFT